MSRNRLFNDGLRPDLRGDRAFAPQYAANGLLSFWFILPTRSLRELVYKRLRAEYRELNYCCEWKDVNGWGLQLSIAGWCSQQRLDSIRRGGPDTYMYHVPD